MQAYEIARCIAQLDDALIIDVLDNLAACYPCTYKSILKTALDNATWHLDDEEKAELLKVLQDGDV